MTLGYKDFLHPNIAVELNVSLGFNYIIALIEGCGVRTLILNLDSGIEDLNFSENLIEKFRAHTYSISVFLKTQDTMLCIPPSYPMYHRHKANLLKLVRLKNQLIARGLILDIGPTFGKKFLANSENAVKLLTTSLESDEIELDRVFLRESINSEIGDVILGKLDNTRYRLCHYDPTRSVLPEIDFANASRNVGMIETEKVINSLDTSALDKNNVIVALCSAKFDDILTSIERITNADS